LGPIIITISSSALKLQIDRKCQKENKNTFGHGFINPKKKKKKQLGHNLIHLSKSSFPLAKFAINKNIFHNFLFLFFKISLEDTPHEGVETIDRYLYEEEC